MKHRRKMRWGDQINWVRRGEDVELRHDDVFFGGIDFVVEIQNSVRIIQGKEALCKTLLVQWRVRNRITEPEPPRSVKPGGYGR